MILFSIVIPVFNGEKYIAKSLTSVIKQDGGDCEIIVVDDGSTDSTVDVVLDVCKKFNKSNIKIVKKENGGLSDARNAGLHEANGKYVIWLDSDDFLPEGALDSLRFLCKKEPDVIISRILSYFEDSNETVENKWSFVKDETTLDKKDALKVLYKAKGFWYSAWSFVTKRSFLMENGIEFEKGIYHEDELWSPKVICLANSFIFNNFPCYVNTANRAGSITTTRNIKKVFDKTFICNAINQLSKSEKKPFLRHFLDKRCFFILLGIYLEKKMFSSDANYESMCMQYTHAMRRCFGWKRLFITILFFFVRILKKEG